MPVWRQIGGHCADHQGVEHALSSVARCQGTCPSFYTGRGPARRPAGASPKRRKKPWCSSRRASWRKASAHLSFADSQAKKRGSVKGSTQVADASPTAEPENKPSGSNLQRPKPGGSVPGTDFPSLSRASVPFVCFGVCGGKALWREARSGRATTVA